MGIPSARSAAQWNTISAWRGPDEHGVKTVIDYHRNEKGDTMKKTTKVKVVNVQKKVYLVSTAEEAGCFFWV